MERGKKRILAVVILLAGIVATGYVTWQGNQGGIEIEENQEEGSLEGLSEREIEEMMNRKVEEGSLAISINTEPHFPSGKSRGSLRIENPANNRYLLVVSIYLEGSREKIYESGGIRPGNKLEYDYLDRKLEKGRYPVEVEFRAYDLESQEYIGKAVSKLEIVVEK